MEIWIIGGAIVALMVYTSTRIKKRAAEAYSREVIETETYSFIKPEGLICPADQLGPETAFIRSEAYGDTEATETTLRAEGMLTVHPKALAGILEELSSSASSIDESTSANGILLKREVREGEIDFIEFHKLIESKSGKIFEFKVKVAKEYLGQFAEKAVEITETFRLKN